jgi:hypothetical protein
MTHLRVEDDILLRDPARVSFLLHSVYPMAYDARDRSVRICGERSDALCRFDSSVPVDVIIRTAFLQEPNLTSKVLEEEMRYPPQFHLEFRTLHPVLDWKPCLTVEVIDK